MSGAAIGASPQAADTEAYVSPFPADFHSAAAEYHRPASRGVQVFSAKHGDAIVGAPRRHLAADLQVCGEAKYQDDAVLPANALHGVMLTSARPHARLLRIDASKVTPSAPQPHHVLCEPSTLSACDVQGSG